MQCFVGGSRLTGKTLKASLWNGQQLRNKKALLLSVFPSLFPFLPTLRLTKNRAGRDGLPVEPEGDLGQDDGHDAGQVGLDHKVPDLPLEVEVCGHDDVFPCRDSQGGLLSHGAPQPSWPLQRSALDKFFSF